MTGNQNEETEQSTPEEEPDVEGFAANLNSSRSNLYRGMSTGLGASDFGMKKKEPKEHAGLAVSDPGAPGSKANK